MNDDDKSLHVRNHIHVCICLLIYVLLCTSKGFINSSGMWYRLHIFSHSLTGRLVNDLVFMCSSLSQVEKKREYLIEKVCKDVKAYKTTVWALVDLEKAIVYGLKVCMHLRTYLYIISARISMLNM